MLNAQPTPPTHDAQVSLSPHKLYPPLDIPITAVEEVSVQQLDDIFFEHEASAPKGSPARQPGHPLPQAGPKSNLELAPSAPLPQDFDGAKIKQTFHVTSVPIDTHHPEPATMLPNGSGGLPDPASDTSRGNSRGRAFKVTKRYLLNPQAFSRNVSGRGFSAAEGRKPCTPRSQTNPKLAGPLLLNPLESCYGICKQIIIDYGHADVKLDTSSVCPCDCLQLLGYGPSTA